MLGRAKLNIIFYTFICLLFAVFLSWMKSAWRGAALISISNRKQIKFYVETKISSMHNVCGHGHGKDSIMARRVLVRSCV